MEACRKAREDMTMNNKQNEEEGKREGRQLARDSFQETLINKTKLNKQENCHSLQKQQMFMKKI